MKSVWALLALGLFSVTVHGRHLSLHQRTCVGLWMPAVHLHGHCILDVTGRSNCSEIDYLFETENTDFDEIPLNKVPHLVLKRALQDHALVNHDNRTFCANVDSRYKDVKSKCAAGYHNFKGKCYTVTKRKVSYEEAQRECGNVHGELVKDDSDEVIGLVRELVHYYVHADIFTGFQNIDDLENNLRDPLEESVVEMDYETGRLQFVVKKARRGFMCVVDEGVSTQPLFESVVLPAVPDNVIDHDLNPLPPPVASVERYLYDLLEFTCPGNYTRGSMESKVHKERDLTTYRADLQDLDDHLPYGCRFNKTLGNVVLDMNSPKHEPRELKKVCPKLVRIYRVHDRVEKTEYFGVHLPMMSNSLEPRYKTVPVGYCAPVKGDCGASIALRNPDSETPVCYLFKSQRDLKTELREQRPLRYVQISNRITHIFTSKNMVTRDGTVQRDPNPLLHNTRPAVLGGVLSPLMHLELSDYCRKHLVPLYRVIDLKHKNSFLSTDLAEVRKYRRDRDRFTEEELLGYCSTSRAYCGAHQPLWHVRTKSPVNGYIEDSYYDVEQNFGGGVHFMKSQSIKCYLF